MIELWVGNRIPLF